MGRDEYAGRSAPGLQINSDSYILMSRTDRPFPGQNVEMEPLTGGPSHSPERGDPNAILNELRQIDQGIDSISNNLKDLSQLQQRALDDPDSSANSKTNTQLDTIASETMTMYRNFAGRIKAIKQQPESGSPKNAPQLGKVDRKLKAAIREYQNMDSSFRKRLQEQMARQYRIVRPDASEAEVREAVEDTSNQQVFSQALLQSDRRGQSRSALNAVQNRHEAIQKIEQQMIELAELFQDMEALVVQQEAAVTNIEMKGEEVVENMDKGTQEIGVAIKSARNARKWKWWCLGICGTFPFPLPAHNTY
jgi:syntaxin 1B/2/3